LNITSGLQAGSKTGHLVLWLVTVGYLSSIYQISASYGTNLLSAFLTLPCNLLETTLEKNRHHQLNVSNADKRL